MVVTLVFGVPETLDCEIVWAPQPYSDASFCQDDVGNMVEERLPF